MEKNEHPACIPFFAHENAMTHLSTSNKRLLIALLAVCITFIATIIIFVTGYTAREKNWLDTISAMQTTEVRNGAEEQRDP